MPPGRRLPAPTLGRNAAYRCTFCYGRLALLCLLQVCWLCAQAGDWRITPRLFVSERYSDNIALSHDNRNEDYVTTIEPGISVRGQGARLLLNLDYNLQKLLYARNNDGDALNHQFQGNATAELLEQVLFLDLNATYSQQQISNLRALSSDNTTLNGNRTDVLSLTASPYLRHHFGPWADVELRYTRNEVRNSSASGLGNSRRNQYDLLLTGGRRFLRLPWKLTVNRREIEEGNGIRQHFQDLELWGGYALRNSLKVVATIGVENNRFFTTRGANDGSHWSAGLLWTPSRRTSVEARLGERYFGRTFFLSGRHQQRRWILTASYNEDTQTRNEIQSNQPFIPLEDLLRRPVFDPEISSSPRLPIDTGPINQAGVQLSKRLDLAAEYQGRRTRGNLRLYRDRRDNLRQARGNETTSTGLTLSLNRSMSRRNSANFGLDWVRTETGAGGTSDQYGIDASLRRRIGPHLDARLRYHFGFRKSDLATDEFHENSLTAYLNFHL